MKKIVLGAVIALCVISCKNTDKVAKENANKETKEASFDPSEYKKGTIVYSEEQGDCEYTILFDNGSSYDPIDLEDNYKKDGMGVYVKYRGLRMANRCLKASPISIEEIHEAKE